MSKFIELHILQVVPFNNINRGEDGAPKSCVYGGYPRARISSQSQKRAVREDMASRDKDTFKGIRTRHIVDHLKGALVERGMDEEKALTMSTAIGDHLGKIDNDDEGNKTKTVLYFSPGECERIAESLIEDESNILKETDKGYSVKKGAIAKVLKNAQVLDNADIAIFGRMVANDPSLTVEGASAFAHAISVHESKNETDFFSAIDEDSTADESGAGHTGEGLYNSATYYRRISLDLNLLQSNLEGMDEDQKKVVVDTFIRSALRALPQAKKNSAFAITYPGYALGVVREKASELSLGDAFEKPVNGSASHIESGWTRMSGHWENLKQQLGSELGTILADVVFSSDPEKGVGVDEFCKGIVANV